MTRKSTEKKDSERASKAEGMDYVKLKSLVEGFVAGGCKDYPAELEDILKDTARCGVVRLPWNLFKHILHYKIEKTLNEAFLGSHSEDDDMPKQLLKLLNNFQQPPFTIQRLCELLVEPSRHYGRRDKYMRALEKNLMVVSTHDPDLTWMRIPTLAHLLEVKPSPSSDKSASPVYDTLEIQPAINRKLDEIVLPHGAPWHVDDFSATSPPDQPCSPHLDPREVAKLVTPPPPPAVVTSAGHKRTSSMRDGDENGSEMVQLQEADSTVADPNPAQEEHTAEAKLIVWEAQELLSSKRRARKLSDSIDDDADVLKALMGPYQTTRLVPSDRDRVSVSMGCCSSKPAGDTSSSSNGGDDGSGLCQTCEQQEQVCIMEEMREEKGGEKGEEYDRKQVAALSEGTEDVHMQSEERTELVDHAVTQAQDTEESMETE